MLKLIYLETENMTSYDIDTIDKWRHSFGNKNQPIGVQEDIWERVKYLKDNGYTHFPDVQMVMGRRGSKGIIGGIIGAERMAHLASLDNPQEYYGIAEGRPIMTYIVATSRTQAKQNLFHDVRQAVENNPWMKPKISTSSDEKLTLMTPNDRRQVAQKIVDGFGGQREVASIQAMAMSSTSTAGRGGSAFVLALDEFAFQITGTGGARSGESILSAYVPAMDQFGKDRLIYVPSSPFSKIGAFYRLYTEGSILIPSYVKDGEEIPEIKVQAEHLDVDPEETFRNLTANPEKLIIQLPSWETYRDWERGEELVGRKFKKAIQYDPDGHDSPEGNSLENIRQARARAANPQVFAVERGGQFATTLDAYLNPDSVDDMFNPWQGKKLRQIERGNAGIIYSAHGDPAHVGDNFAYAIGHVEMSQTPDEFGNYWKHVVIDKTHVWKPADYPRSELNFLKIEKHFEDVLTNFRSMDLLTFDQWNSITLMAQLKQFISEKKYQTQVREETFSKQGNFRRDEIFKTALGLGWIHAPEDSFFNDGEGCLLAEECKFLTFQNGRVDHQTTGPVTTNDLYAAVSVLVERLLGSQLENWKDQLNQPIRVGVQAGIPDLSAFGGTPGYRSPKARKAASKLEQLAANQSRYRYSGNGLPTRGGRFGA